MRKINYEKAIDSIQKQVKGYLKDNNMQCVVIGISGGFDSGLNAALLSPICQELGIPIIGRYIHIESNKEEERERALAIGKIFTDSFKEVDLTPLYNESVKTIEEKEIKELSYEDKLRRGNIKARLRMIYLFDLAQTHHGLVIDNDNLTEHLLGFWTLNGDVGGLTPLADLFKTEAYELAKAYMKRLNNEKAKEALQMVIDAVPTDGLGITSSDVEQFGASSYEEVDNILYEYNKLGMKNHQDTIDELSFKLNKDVLEKIINRHKNSNFKRNFPYRIQLKGHVIPNEFGTKKIF